MYYVFTCQIWIGRNTLAVKRLHEIFAVFTGQLRIQPEIH